ncbi:MAG: helix-turn-helix transcriptional regulator [Proteobacteria bacterium]|nr:helix-turn-helix transcriptional regulator [Pseudomonadota bacterium]
MNLAQAASPRQPLAAGTEGPGRWRLWVDRELRPLAPPGPPGPPGAPAASSRVPGLALAAGRLSTERATDQPRLRRAVREALDHGRAAWLSLTRTHRLPLMLTIDAEPAAVTAAAFTAFTAVTAAADDRAPPRARILLCDPHRIEPDRVALQSLFGLTAAEAAVAARLAAGWHPPQIAAELGVQPNTVAAQIKRTLAKTGAGRQAALVALLRGCTACEPPAPANRGAGLPDQAMTADRGLARLGASD